MTKAKRVALYARVSTKNQSVENQLLELRRSAERNGWTIRKEYVDEGISGAKGRDRRPELDRMLKDAVRREFDVIAVWSVDRLGRSLQDLLAFLNEIHALGVDLFLHQQGLDSTTPAGKALFSMLGVFGEFERSIIVERIHSGIARAKAVGTRSGRPFGRPKVSAAIERKVRALRLRGLSFAAITRQAGCGSSTAQKIVRQMEGDR